MRTTVKTLLLTGLTAVAATALLPAGSAGAHEAAPGETPRALAAARSATARYQRVEVALGDGFLATDECVASPTGGMGHHYLNPARLADGVVADRPEVLLYEEQPNGRMRLVGVEYFVVDADQDPTTVEDHRLAGEHLHGPLGGPGTPLPYHYALHAWVWKQNPSGTFADFNPTVSC